MEKINIAELLKDCSKGMELESPVWNSIVFEEIDGDNIVIFRKSVDAKVYLTQYGEVNSIDGNCVIYPKGKTTWEGFVPPCRFKDGDIIANDEYIAIFHKCGKPDSCISNHVVYYHCWYDKKYKDSKFEKDYGIGRDCEYRFATEEEKQKLFDAIKENGYRWNFQAKRLEELIAPIFKKGDKIRVRNGVSEPRIIDDVCDTFYTLVPISTIDFTEQNRWELVPDKLIKPNFKVGDTIQDVDGYKVEITKVNTDEECYEYISIIAKGIGSIPFKYQNEWKLVPNKFDITTLKPFDKVLVRDCNEDKWNIDFFGYYRDNGTYQCMTFTKNQCIPYNDDTKHLLGNTSDCDEYYKTWE